MRFTIQLFFLCFSVCINQLALGQAPGTYEVEILKADSAIMEAGGPETLKKLIGHVLLKHDQTYIQCDSAVVYASNNIDAYGHVKIWKKSGANVTGNTLKYISLQKNGHDGWQVCID